MNQFYVDTYGKALADGRQHKSFLDKKIMPLLILSGFCLTSNYAGFVFVSMAKT